MSETDIINKILKELGYIEDVSTLSTDQIEYNSDNKIISLNLE